MTRLSDERSTHCPNLVEYHVCCIWTSTLSSPPIWTTCSSFQSLFNGFLNIKAMIHNAVHFRNKYCTHRQPQLRFSYIDCGCFSFLLSFLLISVCWPFLSYYTCIVPTSLCWYHGYKNGCLINKLYLMVPVWLLSANNSIVSWMNNALLIFPNCVNVSLMFIYIAFKNKGWWRDKWLSTVKSTCPASLSEPM